MKDRKKKATYNPYKVSIIIIVGFLVLILLSSMYSKSRVRYQWLTCTKNGDSEEYKEVLQFKFLAKQDGVLYEYYRDETYSYSDKEMYDKMFEYLENYKNDLGSRFNNIGLKYVVKKVNDKDISVHTEVNVGTYGSLFDEYSKEIGINHESDIKDVYKTFVANDLYECNVTESI